MMIITYFHFGKKRFSFDTIKHIDLFRYAYSLKEHSITKMTYTIIAPQNDKPFGQTRTFANIRMNVGIEYEAKKQNYNEETIKKLMRCENCGKMITRSSYKGELYGNPFFCNYIFCKNCIEYKEQRFKDYMKKLTFKIGIEKLETFHVHTKEDIKYISERAKMFKKYFIEKKKYPYFRIIIANDGIYLITNKRWVKIDKESISLNQLAEKISYFQLDEGAIKYSLDNKFVKVLNYRIGNKEKKHSRKVLSDEEGVILKHKGFFAKDDEKREIKKAKRIKLKHSKIYFNGNVISFHEFMDFHLDYPELTKETCKVYFGREDMHKIEQYHKYWRDIKS